MTMEIDLQKTNCENLNYNFFKSFQIRVAAGRGVSNVCPATLEPSDSPGTYNAYEAKGNSQGSSFSTTSLCCGIYPNQSTVTATSKWESRCGRTSNFITTSRVDKYGDYQTNTRITTNFSTSSNDSSEGGCAPGPSCSRVWNYNIQYESDTEFPDDPKYNISCNVSPPCGNSSGPPSPSTPTESNPCGGATLGGIGCVNSINEATCDMVTYSDAQGLSDSDNFSITCPCLLTPFGTCIGPDVPYTSTFALRSGGNGYEKWFNKKTLDTELGLAMESVRTKYRIYKDNLPQNSQGTKCGEGKGACWSPAWIEGVGVPAQFGLGYKYGSFTDPSANPPILSTATFGSIDELFLMPTVSTEIKEDQKWTKFTNVKGTFFIYKLSNNGLTPCDCGEDSTQKFLEDEGLILKSREFNFDPNSVTSSLKPGWFSLAEPEEIKNSSYLGVGCLNPKDLFCKTSATNSDGITSHYILPKQFTWCFKFKTATLKK